MTESADNIGSDEFTGAATSPGLQSKVSQRARLMSGGLWALAGKVFGGIVLVATNMLLARILSLEEFGGYFLALSLVTMCATMAPVGANRAVVRFIAEAMGAAQPAQARAAIRHAMYLGIGGSLTLAVILSLGPGDWLASEVVHSSSLAESVQLVALWIIPATITLLIVEIFRGFRDLRRATIYGGLLASTLTMTVLAVSYVFEIRMGLPTVIRVSCAAAAIGALTAGVVLLRRVRQLPRSTSTKSLMGTLRVSGPLFITTATVLVLSQADIWLLGASGSQQDVATYVAAAKLMFVVSIPLTIVNAVIQPLIAEHYSQKRHHELQRLLRASATIAALPAMAALVCAIMFASPILRLLYGDAYVAGTVVLIILAAGQMVNVWTGSCAIVLMMTGHERALMGLTALTSLMSLTLMAALVGPFGTIGVAAGSAIGVSVHNAVLWMATRRLAGVWTNMGVRGIYDVVREVRAKSGR